MTYEWFIAKRFLQSARRTGFLSFLSLFAIGGITLGTASLIITLSILDGFEKEIKEKAIGFTSHLQVYAFQGKPLPEYRGALRRIRDSLQEVRAISPWVAREAMVRSKEIVDGVFLKGLELETQVTNTRGHLVEGEFLGPTRDGAGALVLGKKLAFKLNVEVGGKVVLFALPAQRSGVTQPLAMAFTVVGLYETGMAEYDDIYAYTDLASAQKLFRLDDQVMGFDVLVQDIDHAGLVADSIQSLLGYPYAARTVFQQYRNLFSWVELQKQLSPILLALIIIVATINIIGTLLMFVLEKTEAIGVLKSMGATSAGIQRMFVLQGAGISAAGILLGNALAFVVCWSQATFKLISIPSEVYYMNSIPISIAPVNFVLVTLITFALCVLTALIPSRAASRVDPVSSLRFG